MQGVINMKAAVIGSRNISFEVFEKYLPKSITEIISSGNNKLLSDYAKCNNIKLTLAVPDYSYGNAACFMRNIDVVKEVDILIAFCNEKDEYIKSYINYFKKINTNAELIVVDLK